MNPIIPIFVVLIVIIVWFILGSATVKPTSTAPTTDVTTPITTLTPSGVLLGQQLAFDRSLDGAINKRTAIKEKYEYELGNLQGFLEADKRNAAYWEGRIRDLTAAYKRDEAATRVYLTPN